MEKRSLGSVLENELMLWFFVCLFSLSFLYTFFLLCSSQAIQTSMRNIWILCCNESLLHFLIFSIIVFFCVLSPFIFFFKYSLPLLRSSIIFKNVFSTWEIIKWHHKRPWIFNKKITSTNKSMWPFNDLRENTFIFNLKISNRIDIPSIEVIMQAWVAETLQNLSRYWEIIEYSQVMRRKDIILIG